jgi:hypothetical protein
MAASILGVNQRANISPVSWPVVQAPSFQESHAFWRQGSM